MPKLRLILCSSLVALPTLITAQSSAADLPEAGGLDTEPGLRLRVFHIGEPFDPDLPLQPGQSPNVDRTVKNVSIQLGTIFSDDQAISDGPDEAIQDDYIAEWTGWIRIPSHGAYRFRINSAAPTSLTLGGRTLDSGPIEFDAGWHSLRLVQKVSEPDHQAISLTWDPPGELVGTKHLRAPAFYFRPTQAGRKELASGKARPGLGKKLNGLHPGYRLTNIRPDGMEMPVGGLGMLSDGRLAVARFDAQTLRGPNPTPEPNGELWLIEGPDEDDPENIRGECIATGLFEPSGLVVLGDDILVSQRHEVSRFRFDSETQDWSGTVVATGWKTNDFHQISAGLPWEPGPTPDHPGFLYMSRGAGLGKGRNPPHHASVWKIDLAAPPGENIEVLTGGHRTPNGLGLNAAGACFVIDNQGHWTPANEINHVQSGHFYGFYTRNRPPGAYPTPFQPDTQDGRTGVTPAAVLLPQDEIANSPTELRAFPKGHIFEGQMALGDMRYGGINRVHLEQVDGVWQGGVTRFTQGLEAGPNRLFFGPDDSLYVGGIGGRHAGTWFWVHPETGQPTFGGLERLTPTGERTFEIHHVTATADGFDIHFTHPVPKPSLEAPGNYQLTQWTYQPTRRYGGPKIDPHPLKVIRAVSGRDRKSVSLTVPGRKTGYVVKLTTDPISDSGKALWSADYWYTLNRIPR